MSATTVGEVSAVVGDTAGQFDRTITTLRMPSTAVATILILVARSVILENRATTVSGPPSARSNLQPFVGYARRKSTESSFTRTDNEPASVSMILVYTSEGNGVVVVVVFGGTTIRPGFGFVVVVVVGGAVVVVVVGGAVVVVVVVVVEVVGRTVAGGWAVVVVVFVVAGASGLVVVVVVPDVSLGTGAVDGGELP